MEMLKGNRTFIIAGLQIASGVLATTDWVSFMSNPKAGMVAIASGIVMAGMRAITDTAPGKKF